MMASRGAAKSPLQIKAKAEPYSSDEAVLKRFIAVSFS